MRQRAEDEPILIKRHAKARFYHGNQGRYVSFEELRRWRESGIPFVVREAHNGEDVTEELLADPQK
jgi:polyhydroxyalkanoate synthesis regulator protein